MPPGPRWLSFGVVLLSCWPLEGGPPAFGALLSCALAINADAPSASTANAMVILFFMIFFFCLVQPWPSASSDAKYPVTTGEAPLGLNLHGVNLRETTLSHR
jgi:hypothetical protein